MPMYWDDDVAAAVLRLENLGDCAVVECLEIGDRHNPDYVARPEVLVVMARRLNTPHTIDLRNRVLAALVRRSGRTIRRRVWLALEDEPREVREDAEQSTVTELLECILRPACPSDDDVEAKYWKKVWHVASTVAAQLRFPERVGIENLTDAGRHPLRAGLSIEQALLFDDAVAHISDSPKRYRTAFTLRYIEGLEIGKRSSPRPCIARILGVSERTVSKYLNRAWKDVRAWREGKTDQRSP